MDTTKLLSYGVKAVLAVTGARLVLVLLSGDGIPVPLWIEAGLLTLSGVAGAVALTGMAMVLADRLAASSSWWRKAGLGVIWLAFLVAMCWLIPPYMVAKMQDTELATVLNTPTKQWAWAIVATAIVEVMAAGGVIAMRETEEMAQSASKGVKPSRWSKLSDALVDATIDRIGPETNGSPNGEIVPSPPVINGKPNGLTFPIDAARAEAEHQKELSKAEAKRKLLQLWAEDPKLTYTDAGPLVGRSRQTVSTYAHELEDDGLVEINGEGVIVLNGEGG